MSFRDIQTQDDVEVYQKRLTDNYPDRPEIMSHICHQIEQLQIEDPTVVELCIGPGQLAETLCNIIPRINYIGLDFIQPFLDFTAAKLLIDGKFVCANLTGAEWPNLLKNASQTGRIDAIVSMQSLHDVGDADQIASIYAQCQKLLGKEGLFINADLITQEGDEANARPGRLTVPHHLELLQAAGYASTGCSLRTAQFGVCFGRNR